MIGPLLAGALVAFKPTPQVLVVDAASFLVSALSLGILGTSFNVAEQRDKGASSRIRSRTGGRRRHPGESPS